MKMMPTIWLMILFALVCSSCGTMSGYANKYSKVQKGMSKKDVKELFGNPHYVRFDDYIDEWEYRRFMPMEDGWSVVVINYDKQELVKGMVTFFEPHIKPVVHNSLP